MQKVQDLIDSLTDLVKKYPEYKNLPIGYASDDEGSSYHKIYNNISPAQFENINERYLELIGFFDDTNPIDEQRDISQKDVNCIIIN